jgi:hypothetical protein
VTTSFTVRTWFDSDPKITTEVYGHVVPGFLRDAIDQLKLGDPIPAPFATRLLPAAENTVEVPAGGPGNNRMVSAM